MNKERYKMHVCVYRYTIEYYSAIKKVAICKNMNGLGGCYVGKISQIEKDKCGMTSCICGV